MHNLKFISLRLQPSQDLRLALEDYVRVHDLGASFVLSCAGSLSRAAIRYAGQTAITMLTSKFEIVSLASSLSSQGAHLHAALADENGVLLGGHVSVGCIVHTTAEILLGVLPDTGFSRELDPHTGCPELVIRMPGKPG